MTDMFEELMDLTEGAASDTAAPDLLRLAGWDINEHTLEVAESVAARRRLDNEPQCWLVIDHSHGQHQTSLAVRRSVAATAMRMVQEGLGIRVVVDDETHVFPPGSISHIKIHA